MISIVDHWGKSFTWGKFRSWIALCLGLARNNDKYGFSWQFSTLSILLLIQRCYEKCHFTPFCNKKFCSNWNLMNFPKWCAHETLIFRIRVFHVKWIFKIGNIVFGKRFTIFRQCFVPTLIMPKVGPVISKYNFNTLTNLFVFQ